jgi:CBS domain-containing protein
MKLVKHLLDSKGRHIVSVAPGTSVLDAIKIMADKAVGSLLVMDNDEIRGIITERDYARKVIIKGRSSETTMVSEIMTSDVLTTSGAQTVNSCMELMTEKRIRHLPVVEDSRVIGMLSMRDLVEAIISDQQEEIEQLEHYISGV